MATEYALWLSSAYGVRRGVIPMEHMASLAYTLVVNAVGSLTIDLTDDALDPTWLEPDARIEVMRKPDGGAWAPEGRTVWLLQKWTRGLSPNGRYRRLVAESAMTLLRRRYTMYRADHAAVNITDEVDNIMKEVVRTNLGSTANGAASYIGFTSPPTRIQSGLTVEANQSLGLTTSKEFAWRNVLSVLQDLAGDAATSSVPLFFEVVWDGSGLTFRTRFYQPGTDRTGTTGRLIVSPEHGNLGGTVEVTEDWTDCATWVVTGGQGQQEDRLVGGAWDTARIGRSPYGVRELFVNATSLTTAASLNAEAASELHRRRPKRTLSGQLLSAPGATYGIDWLHGDRLIAQFDGEPFDALVETVAVKLDGGRESIEAKITGDAA